MGGEQPKIGHDRGMSSEARASWPGRPSLTTPGGVRFREAGPGDAAAVLALKQDLDRETAFMLLEPGERSETVQAAAAELERVAPAASPVLILAEAARGLLGCVDARA